MPDAVICCIAKVEGPYIVEWIKYNLKLGFSRIYIYDNNRDSQRLPNYLKTTELFSNETSRNKISIIPFPGIGRQMEAYNNFFTYYSHRHTWAAILDCDEFIVMKNWEPISSFLSKVCKQGSLGLHWRLYGDSGLKNYSPEPITERFTMCEKSLNHHIKSISLCKHVKNYTNPHYPVLKIGLQHDCCGKILNGPWDYSEDRDKFLNFAYINHYCIKSYEEFCNKKNRGTADNTPKRDDSIFHSHNKNEVQDISAHLFYTNPDLDFST
jgi:hypothetical protein